jgi:polygalacturonase
MLRAAAVLVAGILVFATILGTGTAHAATLATGDPRDVTQPSIPATCATVSSDLSTSDREFSSADEEDPPDTSRIQAALDGCLGTGKAVVLAASGSDDAFLSGPLKVGGDETLLIDAGVTLYASLNPADYQVSGQATCGTIASTGNGCEPFITVNGEDAAIMGTQSDGSQGLIDGRGNLDMYGTSTTWYELASEAQTDDEDQNNPTLIQSNDINDLTIYDLSLRDSPMFHVNFNGGTGFTVWGLRIDTPANARNTDGIDVGGTDVTINDSYLNDGDDCVALKAADYAADNMTIENTHCYGTHGLSIGSETNAGVDNILFDDDTLAGTDSSGIASTSNNGMRIKTDSSVGGLVQDVTYEDICLTGVQDLIDITPFYATGDGDSVPKFSDIVIDGATSTDSASGATSVLDGYDSSDLLGLTLENIDFDATGSSAEYATIGKYNSNLSPSGTDVTVSSVSGSGSAPSCSFPSFPGL